MFTRDHLAIWLSQVHADTELSAHIFKLAFALTQIADTTGFVRSAAVAKLGRDIGDAVEPIADTLGRLIANKHLHAVGDGPKIKGFRLLVRAVNAPLRRRKTAHVIPFPSNRRGAFIRKQADTMAKMSADKGEAYLRSQLAIQGDSAAGSYEAYWQGVVAAVELLMVLQDATEHEHAWVGADIVRRCRHVPPFNAKVFRKMRPTAMVAIDSAFTRIIFDLAFVV
jgi:uncharacterized protein DUF6074